MHNRVFLVMLTAAVLSGCDRPKPSVGSVAEGEGVTRQAEAPSRPLKEPKLPLFDGFEGQAIAGFWLPGDYGTGLHTPEAIQISTDYARAGSRSARITVNEGDIEQKGDDGRSVERAELDSGHYPFIGRDVWYGFSFLLPSGFPVVDNRLVLASWKQSDVEGSPLIGQRFRAGQHTVTIRPPGADGGGISYGLPDLELGRWNDMVYHVRYSFGEDGRIEIWMNGTRVVRYSGPTASKAGADRFYNKVGLYRDRWKEPMTMYLDNYMLGESFEAVDPARVDR
jgi:Polysaccharide lyase